MKASRDDQSPLRTAFVRALKRRTETRPTGTIVLPTGRAAVAEVAKVLRAIERIHQADGSHR
jgi:hypothetical protein